MTDLEVLITIWGGILLYPIVIYFIVDWIDRHYPQDSND